MFFFELCLSSPKNGNLFLLNWEERNNEQTSLKYFIFIVSARNLREISCTWLREQQSKIIYYFYSSFASFPSCPLPLLPEFKSGRNQMIINPMRSLNWILSSNFDVYSSVTAMGATCRYFTRETLFLSSAWLKNERMINRHLSFSLLFCFFLSLSPFLSRIFVLNGFRNWSVDVHRCSLRPFLVAPQGHSCPYSVSPVVTGHPEKLHQQE